MPPDAIFGFHGKRLIAYGAGVALLQTLSVARLPIEYAVDDTQGLAGATIDGHLVIFGGTDEGGGTDTLDVVSYDPASNTWATISHIPTARNIPSSRVRSNTDRARVFTIPRRLTTMASASRRKMRFSRVAREDVRTVAYPATVSRLASG